MVQEYKVILISMSGVRVYNQSLMKLGLTLPGFVDRSKVIASLPNLGLLTLAAYTPKHWTVIYKELDTFTEEDLEQILREEPVLIAFSALTARIKETYSIAQYFRKNNIKTILGGLHASAMPEEAMQYVDTVVQGEGEFLWRLLLEDFEKGKLKPFYSSLQNRDYVFHYTKEHQIPRYDLLDISKYNRLTLQTTRGCPLHCNFCAASRTISSYKKKPIEQVEVELNSIFEIWDRPFIELADDNTFVDKNWSKELLRLFGRYKMKWFTETDISLAYDDELLDLLAKSNCAQVLIGLESPNAQSLKKIDRGGWKFKQFDHYLKAIDKIQSYGISVNGCFILGLDEHTRNTFKETADFITDSNLSEVQITLLTPFPGTDLYQQFKKENRLLEDRGWEKYTLFDITYQPKNFSVELLELYFQELMQEVYSRENVQKRKSIFRNILKHKIVNSHENLSNHN